MKKRPFKSSFEAEKAKCHLRFSYKKFRCQSSLKPRKIVFAIGNISTKSIEQAKAMQLHCEPTHFVRTAQKAPMANKIKQQTGFAIQAESVLSLTEHADDCKNK